MTQATDPITFTDALRESFAEAEASPEQAPVEEAGNAESVSAEEGTAPPAATPQAYKVKVDGHEVEVTLEEALAGYQRQASYTQGTQALAAEKQRLAEAEALYDLIQADPRAALAQLNEAFGDEGGPDLEDLDPLERDVLELKSFADQQRAAQQEAAVDAEFNAVKAKYNDPDLDVIDLLNHAVKIKAETLDDAYKNLHADEWREAAQARQAAEDAVAIEAKRQAIVVDGGSSRSTTGVTTGDGRPKTVREAFAAALEESRA